LSIELQKKLKRIPKQFDSAEEAGKFWDTHSSADYENEMTNVAMEVDIRKRPFVPSPAIERKNRKIKRSR